MSISYIYLALFLIIHGLGHFLLTYGVSCVFPSINFHLKSLTHQSGNLHPSAVNIRRLVRNVFYCLFSSLLGVVLWLVIYRNYPSDTLRLWSVELDIVFHFCGAHWIFSVIEDSYCSSVLPLTLNLHESQKKYAIVYIVSIICHHLLSLFVYLWCIHTNLMSIVGVFGLCFEIPVVLISIRELCIVIDMPIYDLLSVSHVQVFWKVLFCLWHCFRDGLCFLYLISLIFWFNYVSLLPYSTFVVYNTIACLFIIGNCRVYFEILLPACRQDYTSSKAVLQAGKQHEIVVM